MKVGNQLLLSEIRFFEREVFKQDLMLKIVSAIFVYRSGEMIVVSIAFAIRSASFWILTCLADIAFAIRSCMLVYYVFSLLWH